jgi:hypothetical protein
MEKYHLLLWILPRLTKFVWDGDFVRVILKEALPRDSKVKWQKFLKKMRNSGIFLHPLDGKCLFSLHPAVFWAFEALFEPPICPGLYNSENAVQPNESVL